MTTVINFNFLNFFKLRYDERNTSLNLNVKNEVRAYYQYFKNRKQDYSPDKGEVVDITPYSRVINEEDDSSELKMIGTGKLQHPVISYEAHKTYNSKGRTIRSFQEKGLLVNSYA